MFWPQVVGEQMARASEAQRVQAGGTLLVNTRSSVWSQELSFHKPAILRRYKERLGKEWVKDLRFSVGPVRGVAASAGLSTPPEEEVRRIRLEVTRSNASPPPRRTRTRSWPRPSGVL